MCVCVCECVSVSVCECVSVSVCVIKLMSYQTRHLKLVVWSAKL